MKVPEEWAMRAAVVCAPWVHPEPEDRYPTLLDAVIGIGATEEPTSPWIILEDGRIVSPPQIARLRCLVGSGAFIGTSIF